MGWVKTYISNERGLNLHICLWRPWGFCGLRQRPHLAPWPDPVSHHKHCTAELHLNLSFSFQPQHIPIHYWSVEISTPEPTRTPIRVAIHIYIHRWASYIDSIIMLRGLWVWWQVLFTSANAVATGQESIWEVLVLCAGNALRSESLLNFAPWEGLRHDISCPVSHWPRVLMWFLVKILMSYDKASYEGRPDSFCVCRCYVVKKSTSRTQKESIKRLGEYYRK